MRSPTVVPKDVLEPLVRQGFYCNKMYRALGRKSGGTWLTKSLQEHWPESQGSLLRVRSLLEYNLRRTGQPGISSLLERLEILEDKLATAEREWAENPALYQRELARESAIYPPWLLGGKFPNAEPE